MTPTSTVRAYHLLSSHYALDNLRRRRLKIARLDDLNDPFDLWTLAQPDRKLRTALRLFRREVTQTFGMVWLQHGVEQSSPLESLRRPPSRGGARLRPRSNKVQEGQICQGETGIADD